MSQQQRILLVDDEESIRATLPLLLESYGFAVTTASTVPEALQLISQQAFEVLIADLNIGSPGDGFTIVSAMRRTQPDATTLILTGYPAFETALEAIRQQVDDYLTKPTDIDALVANIRSKLTGKRPARRISPQRLPDVIEQDQSWIVHNWLAAVKKDPRLSSLRLSDDERTDHVPRVLKECLARMRKEEVGPEAVRGALQHGAARRRQGYTVPLIIREAKLLQSVIGSSIERNLLAIELSRLISDMICLWETIQTHLEVSVEAFLAEPQAGASGSAGGNQSRGSRRK